jgi:protein dithiol oxidoreductase (disulfide-forming)
MKNSRRYLGLNKLLAVTALFMLGTIGLAQASVQQPQAGVDFKLVQPAQPTDQKSKIEVIEFFWYGCPHCFAFDPILEAWVKKLPADVSFKRVPVAFRPDFEIHSKLFYALEVLQASEALHKKVFDAIHIEQKKLDKPEALADFVAANGIDRVKFLEALNSFSVQAKVAKAKKTFVAYKIEGVPTMAVNGKFTTAATLVGNHQNALLMVDYLVQQERQAQKMSAVSTPANKPAPQKVAMTVDKQQKLAK